MEPRKLRRGELTQVIIETVTASGDDLHEEAGITTSDLITKLNAQGIAVTRPQLWVRLCELTKAGRIKRLARDRYAGAMTRRFRGQSFRKLKARPEMKFVEIDRDGVAVLADALAVAVERFEDLIQSHHQNVTAGGSDLMTADASREDASELERRHRDFRWLLAIIEHSRMFMEVPAWSEA